MLKISRGVLHGHARKGKMKKYNQVELRGRDVVLHFESVSYFGECLSGFLLIQTCLFKCQARRRH